MPLGALRGDTCPWKRSTSSISGTRWLLSGGILLFQSWFGPASRQADISYSQFETYLQSGRISRIAIDEQYIRGEFT